MSTVSTGLILEVGEPEVLSDSGLVLEQVEIWGTDWINDPDSPIYEQVVDGGQMVQTGVNLIQSEPMGVPNWLKWGVEGSYIVNGTENQETDLGATNNIAKVFGPSMCGDYKMFRRGFQDSPNLCVHHEGVNGTFHSDNRGSDPFNGCDIVGVKTYGLMDWNEAGITNTGGTYDFWFDDNSGGNMLSDNFEQIFEFTCRQFSFQPNLSYGYHRRVCDFATLNNGENNFEQIFQYSGQGNSDWYDNYIPGTNSLLHLGTSGTPNEDGPSGNTGYYSGNVDLWSDMWNAGNNNYQENFEYSDGTGNDVNYTETTPRSIAGSEIVTGRTLYLWPREWCVPDNMTNYNNFEFTDEGWSSGGGAYYGPHQTGATMRWSKAPYDGMLTFDILDAFDDRLYVKGTGNTHPVNWINSLPGIDWPDGVDQTFENFLSFYHCDVSPWLLSDGWRPDTHGPSTSNLNENTQGGLTFNSLWKENIQKPHIGSWVAGQYPFTDSKGVTSIYKNTGALGWRAFAKYQNMMLAGQDGWEWADEGGFGIYVKASNFQNAKILIYTDVNGDSDINMIQSNCIDPGTGLPPDLSAGPPYILQTLTQNNPETQNQFPSGVDEEQDPNNIGYPFTYNNNPGMVYGPKAYSDHWGLDSNEAYSASKIMEHKIMPNGNANSGTEAATFTESFVSKDWIYQGEGTFCQWTWIKVVPINKFQPFSVTIDEIRVVPATVGSQTIEQPVYTWQNNYSDVLVGYEQMEVDVLEGYGQEVVSEWNITTTKQKWDYLDILKQENPVALTYNSGDLKDIKKRSAGYSKTFELPQNKHNQAVLNSISATNSEKPKESIQWRQARIKSNGVVIFRGFARIEESVSGKGGSYKCHIMEDPSWWPNMIADKKLCDLTIPIHYKVTTPWVTEEVNPNCINEDDPCNELVSWPTIQDTWGQTDGVYNNGSGDQNHPHGAYNPYGDWQDPSVLGTGLGYVYPAISYGKWFNMDSWSGIKSGKDFHPSYYVRYLVEEIFRNINYKVTSNFLTSETFSRLIIPYTSGEEYDNADSMLGEDGNFKVVAKTTEKNFWNNVNCYNANLDGYGEIDIWEDDDHGVYMPRLYDIEDPSGLFSTTGWGNCGAVGGYRVPFSGRYRLYFRGNVRWANTNNNNKHMKCKWLIKRPSYSNSWRIIHPNNGTNTVSYNTFRYTNSIQSQPNNSMIVTNTDSNFDFNFEYIEGFPNGHTIAWDEEYETTNPYGCYTFLYDNCFSDVNAGWADGEIGIIEEDMCGSSYDDGQCWHSKDMSCLMDLKKDDVIQVAYFAWNDSAASNKMYVDVKDQKFMIFPDESSGEAPPSVVSPKYVLGCKTKQIDIIKGITEMFNLHWTADAESRTISCEPYNEFYGTGKIVDWSSKLDHSSWTDLFIIDQLAKIVNYTYKTDNSDGPITRWEDENKPDTWLGNLIEEGDLYRKEEEVRGTTVFHSTMSINDRTFYPPSFNGDGERWLPCLWPKSDEDNDWLSRVEDDNSYTQYSFSGADEELYTDDYGDIMNTPRPDASYNYGIRILNYYGSRDKNFKFLSDGSESTEKQPYADYYDHYIIDEDDGPLEYINGEYGDPLGIDPFNLSWKNIVSPAGKVSPGLYQKYWKNLHEKINGGAALRTCMMNLKDADVSGFDYRDIIRLQIGGVMTYWTVNRIIDYKPGGNQLTKVELVEFDRPPRIKSHDEDYMRKAIGPPENPTYIPSKVKNIDLDFIEKKKKSLGGNIKSKKKKISQKTKSVKAKTINGKTSFSLNNNTNNISKNESISLGHGLRSSGSQSVLGAYNQPKSSDQFQIGGGYVTKRGEVKRRNALTIDQHGDITFYGGEIVAEFTTGDISIIGDVYYTDENGKTRKLYL